MMGLGYLGNGGSSSSSSNLSPLAPPFTVDRSNPKPNSNPVTNFTEPPPPYGVPFSSSLHNWQYSHSSASRPDFGSSCHSEIDSIRTASLPSANNYHYFGSESINPPSTQWAPPKFTLSNAINPFSCAPKHYYPPYASQMDADDTLLVGLNEANYNLLSTSSLVPTVGSSQADCTLGLSGLEFPPPWGGFWNGSVEGKQGRRTEIDGSFCLEEITDVDSLVFKDYTNQGAVPVECSRKCEENPAMSQRKYDDVLGRENLAGSLGKGQLNDNFLVQSLRFIPSGSTKAPIFGSGTISTESHLESPSLEPGAFFCNRQNTNSPYEKRFQLFESCTNDCISVTKSSPTVTIRPPAFGAKSSASDTVSSKTVDIGNVAAANSKDVSSHNQSIKKVPHLPPSSEGKEGCLDVNLHSFHIGRNDHHIFAASSSTKEDQSNELLFRNALDHPIKARFGAQVPDLNVSHGFSLAADSTEAFKHTSNSSESLDHHNPAEDSPCWKGAPASHVSPFETLEAMPLQHLMKKSEACVGLNFQGTQNFPPYNDHVTAFSPEVCETSLQKESLCTDKSTSLRPTRSFKANLPAKEHMAGDAARAKSDGVELNKSDGVQISDNVDNPTKEYDLLNGLKSDSVSIDFHTKQASPKEVTITSKRKPDLQTGFVDVGFNTSDTLEKVDCVPLHAAENVLRSSSSVEDAVKLQGIEPSPKMNLQVLVNAMHNLSELLLFQCSNDACALKEQDCKALEHSMKNIDMCLSKKITQSTPTQEPMFPREEGSSQLVEEVPNLHSGTGVLRSQAMNEVGTASHGQLDSQCTNEQKRECDISGKKFEKNLDFISSRDDADITRHHNMVQDIRKALDENFQLEEVIPSEAMLFKNLWLDVEAELCSIGFRARFDRVKIQMENCKSDKTKENQMAVEKLPSSIISPDLNITNTSTPESNDNPWQKAMVQYSCISNPTSHVDDVEASVMARFHILESRGDNSNAINVEEKQLPEVVEVGFSRKRNQWHNIGKQSQNKIFDVVVGSCLQHHIGHNAEDKAGTDIDDPQNETMKEVRLRVTDDNKNNSLQNELASGLGCFDNNSSDWEHVLKDDFA